MKDSQSNILFTVFDDPFFIEKNFRTLKNLTKTRWNFFIKHLLMEKSLTSSIPSPSLLPGEYHIHRIHFYCSTVKFMLNYIISCLIFQTLQNLVFWWCKIWNPSLILLNLGFLDQKNTRNGMTHERSGETFQGLDYPYPG